MRLEPLSDQNALLGFLRNVDNAKTLTEFVQELANAIIDYQVCAAYPVLARFIANAQVGFYSTRGIREGKGNP